MTTKSWITNVAEEKGRLIADTFPRWLAQNCEDVHCKPKLAGWADREGHLVLIKGRAASWGSIHGDRCGP